MEYVKLFEEFINEANEEILAQGACKNAMFIAQKEVDKFLKVVEKRGMIQNPKTKVSPYNSGYEMSISFKQDWRLVSELPKEEQEAGQHLFGLTSSISMQPSTFFESSLEEGTAKIEGVTLNVSRDMLHEEKYPKWNVKSKGDIKKVQKEYVEIIKRQIEYLTDKIN